MMAAARARRDALHPARITYSPKVFIPLTKLCRDVCRYCTFAHTPRHVAAPYLSIQQVLDIAAQGAEAGCHEALFTLGDRPESRYKVAREGLQALGHDSTLSYLAECAGAVLRETGLLPHVNAGVLDAQEWASIRPVSVSSGLMLESTAARLGDKGGPHHGCPDKVPAVRLASLAAAGVAAIPFTSGILIGIGETREERIQALLELDRLHAEYGHIQEVIVQNFRAKPGTGMATAPEPSLQEHLWSIAAARLILAPEISVQAPPNLNPGALDALIDAGIDDFGGISPVTPDHVNPEAPWPLLETLREATEKKDRALVARLPLYPGFVRERHRWLAADLHRAVLERSDADGLARDDRWRAGVSSAPPATVPAPPPAQGRGQTRVGEVLERLAAGEEPGHRDTLRLLQARGTEVTEVLHAADRRRREVNGDEVTYVVNRNINYTNLCYFGCRFCAFSKGKKSASLRGAPYDLTLDEIARRTVEAWERGATEVCLQGGIHPDYTGQTYLDILAAVKTAAPEIHVHAFSPLEVWQGARTLGLTLQEFLTRLRDAGLASLPGTAAEILDDEVRRELCPDKIDSAQWLEVMRTAHGLGLRSTATIMFGHIETPDSWARHLLAVRQLAGDTGGFTEFVPLAFVAGEAPIYRSGRARPGPTFREVLLVHAVARLVLHPHVPHVQASWVKLGPQGVRAALAAGVDDLGGTLMNESITRAAGASFGEELPPAAMQALIREAGRSPRQRSTLYGKVSAQRQQVAVTAATLTATVNTPPRRVPRRAGAVPVRFGTG
jgi:FO synthase